MSVESINITLGTAGHIDHGKTALVKCLTGCETDRLKEEKERGMSIELGFAPCMVANRQIGIVDVPGHEHFIRTMVAGAAGIDGVILVVAADDGVMPQTREHLDIIHLLGIKKGLVALTKVDRINEAQQQRVTEQLQDYLAGTFLDGAPICPVSNITGKGFDGFLNALEELVHSITPKPSDGVFRLPVERAFSAKGCGTVIAGIPVSGEVRVGDSLVLLPQGETGRVKSIQVYQQNAEQARAGQCAAINIPHLDYGIIERGNTLTVADTFTPQQWWIARLRVLDHPKLFVKNALSFKFHTGTSETLATIYLTEGDRLEAGEEQVVQLRMDIPLVAAPGDRFILRSLSPMTTIGGGLLVEGSERILRRSQKGIHQELEIWSHAVIDPIAFIEYVLQRSPVFSTGVNELSRRVKLPVSRCLTLLKNLADEGKIITIAENSYIHAATVQQVEEKLLNEIRLFHQQSPESPGMEQEALLKQYNLSRPVGEFLIKRLKSKGLLIERNQRLSIPEHRETYKPFENEQLAAVEQMFRRAGFNPPGAGELINALGLQEEQALRLIRILLEHETLIRVQQDLIFHSDAINLARRILVEHLRKKGSLQSVDFKYLLNTTRKYAIPLLDYFDKVGLTRRVGYTRYLKTPI